jgi:hypothetical protein
VVIGSEKRLDGLFLILYSQDRRFTRRIRRGKVWSRDWNVRGSKEDEWRR